MAEKSSLKQAREVAGLSVEQIASLTNIRPAVIKDLENNSVEVCGGIAYARGHIRSIVKVLNQKTPKSISFDADLRSFTDETAEKGKLYTYVITSLDRLKNESEASNSVTVKAN